MSDQFQTEHQDQADQLESLGERLHYPPTPDLASAVREEIETREASRHRLFNTPRRWIAIALVLALLGIGALLIYIGS